MLVQHDHGTYARFTVARGPLAISSAAVFWLVLLLQLCSTRAAAGATAVIKQLPPGTPDTQLLQAFANQSVTTILLDGDYAVGDQFDPYSGPPETTPTKDIFRNITLTGLPGQDPVPMLNFQFKLCVLKLCDSCWFHLDNISVKDERMGANAQFDFFLGDGNSVIYARNVVRNRKSCTDIGSAGKLVNRTQRSPRFLGPGNTTEQIWEAADLVWRGQSFPRTLHLLNYSADFPKHYNGGYVVVLNNTYRMCHSYADPTCLVEKEADMCVFQDIQRILAEEHWHGHGQGLSGGATAGVVVGAVVLLLVLGAVGALLLHRRRLQRGALYQGSKSTSLLPDPETGAFHPSSNCCDVAAGTDSRSRGRTDLGAEGLRSSSSPKAGGGGSGPKAGGGGSGGGALGTGGRFSSPGGSGVPFTAGQGRQLSALPGVGASQGSPCNILSDLQFGVLLGTGSFGRVCKARLGDSDVAVKVIEHESRMSERVANEVNLMLSCKHSNVVCAYHYVTFKNTQHGSEEAASIRGTGSKPNTRLSAGSPKEPAQVSLQGQPGSNGSREHRGSNGSREHRGSNNSMDMPVPVLPGPKVPRTCPACEREPRPALAHHQGSDDYLTISNSTAPVPFSSGTTAGSSSSNAASTGSQHSQHHSAQATSTAEVKCICSCSSQAPPESGLLNWQHEGGFWPAGPSALLEQQQDTDFAEQDDDNNMVTTWLIQEFCDQGTLCKQANSWVAAEDDVQMIKRLMLLQDVAKGLSYLHSKCIVHGDLNARNVLVTTNYASPCGLTAKLADLGLSRIIKQHNTHHTTCTVGTMSHMPPELLRHGHMSTQVDIYAYGIMMWELFTREIAFRELHYGQFFETVVLRNQRPVVPASMPEDYRVLMEHCWSAEPGERPSTATVQKCIGLMIADRQHSLGMPVRSSIDVVDQEYGRERGSSDGGVSKSIMQQVAAQCTPQPQPQPQPHQQHMQRQHVLERYPTPARLAALHPQHPHPQQQLQQQHASPPGAVHAPGVQPWHHLHDPLRGQISPSQPGHLAPHHAPQTQQVQGCNGAIRPGLVPTNIQQQLSPAGPAAAQEGPAVAGAAVGGCASHQADADGGHVVWTSQPYIRDL